MSKIMKTNRIRLSKRFGTIYVSCEVIAELKGSLLRANNNIHNVLKGKLDDVEHSIWEMARSPKWRNHFTKIFVESLND